MYKKHKYIAFRTHIDGVVFANTRHVQFSSLLQERHVKVLFGDYWRVFSMIFYLLAIHNCDSRLNLAYIDNSKMTTKLRVVVFDDN